MLWRGQAAEWTRWGRELIRGGDRKFRGHMTSRLPAQYWWCYKGKVSHSKTLLRRMRAESVHEFLGLWLRHRSILRRGRYFQDSIGPLCWWCAWKPLNWEETRAGAKRTWGTHAKWSQSTKKSNSKSNHLRWSSCRRTRLSSLALNFESVKLLCESGVQI